MAGDEESGLGTEDWTDSLDRGGLWHVSDQVFRLFYAMEEEIRAVNQSRTPEKSIQKEFTEKLHSSETVMFHWSIISAEIDEDQGERVLSHIIRIYVSIRGAAFAASCLEMYKQKKQKNSAEKEALANCCIFRIDLSYHIL